MHKIKNTPADDEDIVNKQYVDKKTEIDDKIVSSVKTWSSEKISKINVSDAKKVDAKPTYATGTITYVKDGTSYTTTNTKQWFYYFDNGSLKQTIFIDGEELTIDGASVDFDEYVKKISITDTIDSTSTSTDIASAKGVYDYIGTLNSLTGDIEYGNFKLVGNYTITSPTETSVKELIPFTDLLNSEGNMVSNNGLIALKKGKTYKITSAIRTNDVSSTDNGFIEFCLYDNKGNLLKQGIYNSGIVYRGNYPINYTITPSEDISVGIYITYRTAPIKIIVGENRSYLNITEIPNPTSIMNVTDEHIKEVATTNLSKLQFAPFSDGWQMEIKHEQVGETDYVIIDSFKDNEILRYVLRQKTQTKEQSIAMLYSDDGGTTFKNANNVCTTKVFDIALTKLTIKDSYSTGNVYYQVKNGECTISGQQFRRTTATGAVNNVILIEGLPKCSTTVPSAPILYFGEVKGQVWMSSNSTDLKISVPTAVGDTGENCVFTIKYPVSES